MVMEMVEMLMVVEVMLMEKYTRRKEISLILCLHLL